MANNITLPADGSLSKQRGMRECMFCVLLVAALLVACLLTAIATASVDNDAIPLMSVERRKTSVEASQQRKLDLYIQSLHEEKKEKHGIVQCIEKVESVLVPFLSDETGPKQDDNSDIKTNVMLLRKFIIKLQLAEDGNDDEPQSVDGTKRVNNSSDKDKVAVTGAGGLIEADSKGKLNKREIDAGMKPGLRSVNFGGADKNTIVENRDSFAYERAWPANDIDQQIAEDYDLLKSKGQETEQYIDDKSPVVALVQNPLSYFLQSRTDDHSKGGAFLEIDDAEKLQQGGSGGSEKAAGVDDAKEYPPKNSVLREKLEKANIMVDLYRGMAHKKKAGSNKESKEILRDERAAVNAAGDNSGTPAAKDRAASQSGDYAEGKARATWKRPVALAALGAAALVGLALITAPRLRRMARGGGHSHVCDEAEGDDEMLVPNATTGNARATHAPLWAQYLRRASSPEPVATHVPRSTLRLVRDALRSYANRSRSQRRYREPNAHGVARGAAANLQGSGDVLPTDATLGSIHV